MNNEDTDALGELSSVLDRLNKRLDDMEKGDMPFPPVDADKDSNDDDNGDDNGDDSKEDEKTEKAYGDEKDTSMTLDLPPQGKTTPEDDEELSIGDIELDDQGEETPEEN